MANIQAAERGIHHDRSGARGAAIEPADKRQGNNLLRTCRPLTDFSIVIVEDGETVCVVDPEAGVSGLRGDRSEDLGRLVLDLSTKLLSEGVDRLRE